VSTIIQSSAKNWNQKLFDLAVLSLITRISATIHKKKITPPRSIQIPQNDSMIFVRMFGLINSVEISLLPHPLRVSMILVSQLMLVKRLVSSIAKGIYE